MAVNKLLAGESGGDDLDRKVRASPLGLVVVAGVMAAVVGHGEPHRMKTLGEDLMDFFFG
jgi:hypothetical protein